MRAVVAYALRRTSARLVLAVGVVGLFWVVYRAVQPLRFVPAAPLACGTCYPSPVEMGSTPWDLAAAALTLGVAAAVAAALFGKRLNGR